ncbi:DUF3889 domain-containing protein [Bacillus sp. MRMR6]|uniref:DUF3889 domain-containing protein n=1 Tax=Bacillus sp. MRMR6 TaxID=1928617 RepID=UPI0009534117|nr:DUF3889 domain-containing protein [Bacillus sp. MRMR6]OLS33615.1 hypothetical protein BTR25_24985 [Bacillus sp. MRMR6]
MKKTIISIIVSLFVLIGFNDTIFAQKPDYEKYGRIAMAVVKEDYPGDAITEYEYLGRKKVNETSVEDSFRFQVQENNIKYLVTIKVNHNIANNKLLTITVDSKKQ